MPQWWDIITPWDTEAEKRKKREAEIAARQAALVAWRQAESNAWRSATEATALAGPITQEEAMLESLPRNSWDRAITQWRNQAPVQEEPEQPKQPPSPVDPWVLDEPVTYDVQEPSLEVEPEPFALDYSVQPPARDDDTLTTDVQSYVPGMEEWQPDNWLNSAIQTWTQTKPRELSGWYRDSAANERAQFQIAERNRLYDEKYGAGGEGFTERTWGDVQDEAGHAWDALQDNAGLFFEGAADWWSGERTLPQVLQDNWDEVQLTPLIGPASATVKALPGAAAVAPYTEGLGNKAMNVADTLQATQDFVLGAEVEDEVTAGAYVAATRNAAWDLFKEFFESGEGELAPRLARTARESWVNSIESFQQAVTPTVEQLAQMTPEEIERNKERAYLNWGDASAVETTFDELVNQESTVQELTAQAARLYEQGALAEDEEERLTYWRQAAELGAQAYALQTTHPVEIVNQNTNLAAQLFTELLLPDITDLAGGVIAALGASPKARRLTQTASEVANADARAIEELASLAVGPQTRAVVGSDYNPHALWKGDSWWTTGEARANIASDRLHRYVSQLLGDVDTVADMRLILRQVAAGPRRLITGMDVNLFQSEGLLQRADSEGLVRFGSMNLSNIKEPLKIYQNFANEFVNTAQSLNQGPLLHKHNFLTELHESALEAGRKFYNVATENGTPQRSWLGWLGAKQRQVVSPFYIYLSPGTWMTNILGGAATALGDGSLAGGTIRSLDNHLNKLFGVDPTLRGFQGAASGQAFAEAIGNAGVLEPVRRAYGNIDEWMGKRVYYKSVTHALKQVGQQMLEQSVVPILRANGVTDERVIRQMTNHLFETGFTGGNLVEEFTKLMGGRTRIFSLSDVNRQWIDALDPDSLQNLYAIIRAAPDRQSALAQLEEWLDQAQDYWGRMIQEAPITPQRHTWMTQEAAQDMADVAQVGKMAERHGVPAQEVIDYRRIVGEGIKEGQNQMQRLMDVVAELGDPNNRYMLYDIWGRVTDLTTDVRAQLAELAEQTYHVPAVQQDGAWRNYFVTAQRLWTERNQQVNTLLDDAAQALIRGESPTPNLSQWDILERTARQNEEQLWFTLRLEPQSGAYDDRLRQVIEAGRAISDKAMARVYAAARRFNTVDAFDHIVSAERNVQMAGAQARTYLDRVLTSAINSGDWEDYYSIRNEVWRQLRHHEQLMWRIAERQIVQDGLATEITTGLKFDAGPDGIVELLRPEDVVGQRTNRMRPEKQVTQNISRHWVVRREDGTITTIPDNMVPEELRSRYDGLTPDEVEAQVELELDNIASALPYEEGIATLIDAPTGYSADELAAMRRMERKKVKELLGDTLRGQGYTDNDIGRMSVNEMVNTVQDATVEGTMASSDAKRIADELNLGASTVTGDVEKAAQRTIANTTQAGATQAPELALAAQHAREQIRNIHNYVVANLDDILTPKGAIGEGQSLRALDDFRRRVLPAWDNAKYIAAEYGNRMRSFTMVDFANNTRLDEVASLLMPYSFWMSRSIKNSLERAIFEPHIWNRITKTEREISEMREQQGDPHRYDGAIPIDLGNGTTIYLRLSPSKYWPTFGLFTQNDYANPESANNALSYAIESFRAGNASLYPWFDVASKIASGETDDIYPMGYIPQGRLIGWTAAKLLGPDIPEAIRPGYYEYNVGRELTTMVSEGEITAEQAQWTQDMLRQMRTGEEPLPEQAARMGDLTAILEEATKRAANKEMVAASTSFLTGVQARPFDQDEHQAIEAIGQYNTRGYDPVENPYGSELAMNATYDDYPELGPRFSQGAIYQTEKKRPGIRAVESEMWDRVNAAQGQLYTAGDNAVDSLITANRNATRDEINDARLNAILTAAASLVGQETLNTWLGNNPDPYYVAVVQFVRETIQQGYPSAGTGPDKIDIRTVADEEVQNAATSLMGEYQVNEFLRANPDATPSQIRDWVFSERGPGAHQNPVEQVETATTETLEEVEGLFPYPVWPGADASREEKAAYYAAKEEADRQRSEWIKNRLNVIEAESGVDPSLLVNSTGQAATAYADYRNRYKTELEIERLAEIDAENEAKYRANQEQWARRRSVVVGEFGQEAGDLWDTYYNLPKGDARKAYLQDHPGMKLYNLVAYNPDEYAQAKDLFGVDALIAWANTPAWADTEEARAARNTYYDANPKAWSINAWMYGRNGGEGDSPYDFGRDYAQARELFGEDIWSIVEGYKRGWDKNQKRSYYDQFPQLSDFYDWWYGNSQGVSASSATGRQYSGGRSYGGYSRGGFGGGGFSINFGGGGSSGPKRGPQVAARQFDRTLMPYQFRDWRPETQRMRMDWLHAGSQLKPEQLRKWRAPI